MADDKMYVWMGSARKVFKPGIKAVFEKGVPSKVPDFFEDLFQNDPNFVPVTLDEGTKTLADIEKAKDPKARAAAVTKAQKGLEKAHRAHVKAWTEGRNKARADRKAAAAAKNEAPGEAVAPPVKAKKKAGGGRHGK